MGKYIQPSPYPNNQKFSSNSFARGEHLKEALSGPVKKKDAMVLSGSVDAVNLYISFRRGHWDSVSQNNDSILNKALSFSTAIRNSWTNRKNY